MSESTADPLLDRLIGSWGGWETSETYYLTELAPAIVRGSARDLTLNEREIITQLRKCLTSEQWLDLPALIETRYRLRQLEQIRADEEASERRERARQRTEQELRQRAREDAERQREDRRRAEKKRQKRIAQRESDRKRRQQEEHQRQSQRREAEVLERRRTAIRGRISAILESDFLAADAILASDGEFGLIAPKEYEQRKTRFVQIWAERVLHQVLDSEQAAAVAAVAGNVQVVARAGSGKTRTLVTRAVFLQQHCRVSSRSLLLLAFNKRAAEEMRDRLKGHLGDDLPHVMTFHALAHAIVHPEEHLVVDDRGADQLGVSREVQDVIDEHVRSDAFRERIRDLMLAHFRDDWERIVEGRFHLTVDEFLSHRRSLPRESLKGEYVKSFGERVIANALFEHGVKYTYERNFRWDGINYRPDFTIPLGPNRGLIIEYFGLQGEIDYDEAAQRKRDFWSGREGWTLLEVSPADVVRLGVDGFVRSLLSRLRAADVSCARLSEEDIWALVKRRALDRFTSAMRTFVGRCRKTGLAPEEVANLVASHDPCVESEMAFLEIGVSVYAGYLKRLASTSKEDFDGLMWRAIRTVGEGRTRFARDSGREQGDLAQMRFVLIDEFQDFSQMFSDLVSGIRSASPTAQFFCVGDDWQAINGFAGSDLGFFTNFGTYFPDSRLCEIRTNYRSPRKVVELGNAVMAGRGPASQCSRVDGGLVWLCMIDDFEPSAPEQARHNGDDITPAVLRLVRNFLDRGLDVVLLSRRNGLPWYVAAGVHAERIPDQLERFLAKVRNFLPEEDRGRVKISTAHKYKGLEEAAVIILDAVSRSYPLIHPNWVFLRVFGDTLNGLMEEERRLFYVAVTRAQQSLAVITESRRESPYLAEARRTFPFTLVPWSELAPAPSIDGVQLEIRVFNCYDVKDQLKDLNFRWDAQRRCWLKAVLAEGFSFETLRSQGWCGDDQVIEVYSEKGELLHRR